MICWLSPTLSAGLRCRALIGTYSLCWVVHGLWAVLCCDVLAVDARRQHVRTYLVPVRIRTTEKTTWKKEKVLDGKQQKDEIQFGIKSGVCGRPNYGWVWTQRLSTKPNQSRILKLLARTQNDNFGFWCVFLFQEFGIRQTNDK